MQNIFELIESSLRLGNIEQKQGNKNKKTKNLCFLKYYFQLSLNTIKIIEYKYMVMEQEQERDIIKPC